MLIRFTNSFRSKADKQPVRETQADFLSSLNRRIIRRVHVGGFHLLHEYAVLFRLGLFLHPIRIIPESLPALFCRFLAREGENVNELPFRFLWVGWVPERDDRHAVLFEELVRMVAEAGVQRFHLAGVGIVDAQLENAGVGFLVGFRFVGVCHAESHHSQTQYAQGKLHPRVHHDVLREVNFQRLTERKTKALAPARQRCLTISHEYPRGYAVPAIASRSLRSAHPSSGPAPSGSSGTRSLRECSSARPAA